MPISSYLADKLISHTLRGNITGTEYVPPSAVYLALHSGEPTIANEFAGGAYARQLATFALPLNGATSNLSTIVFSNLPTSLVGATHVGIWDAVTEGNLLYWGAREPEAINSGDTLSWGVSSVDVVFKVVI